MDFDLNIEESASASSAIVASWISYAKFSYCLPTFHGRENADGLYRCEGYEKHPQGINHILRVSHEFSINKDNLCDDKLKMLAGARN